MANGNPEVLKEYFIKYSSAQTFPVGTTTEIDAKEYVKGKLVEDSGVTLWVKNGEKGVQQIDLS
jgi:hypothetical protein